MCSQGGDQDGGGGGGIDLETVLAVAGPLSGSSSGVTNPLTRIYFSFHFI